MNLHKNKELFSQAVEMTSQHFRIKREFIEKDYWIYLYLKIFEESGTTAVNISARTARIVI